MKENAKKIGVNEIDVHSSQWRSIGGLVERPCRPAFLQWLPIRWYALVHERHDGSRV